MYILAIIALIGFIFRLQAINLKGHLKYYDYDREIAKKYEIYSMCTESAKYTLYHFIGIFLSVISIVSSVVGNLILTTIFSCCVVVYAFIYGYRYERHITIANENEKKCVFLLNHIIDLEDKEDYQWKTSPKDATDIYYLYLCCNHDKMTLLFDLIPLFLLVLSLTPSI